MAEDILYIQDGQVVRRRRLFQATEAAIFRAEEPAMWDLMPEALATPAKLELPDKFEDVVELCRFCYKRDPIGATVINKMVEIGVTQLHNKKGDCSDFEFAVFDALKDGFVEFLRNCTLEYLISGLVVVEKDWENIKPSVLDPSLRERKVLNLPMNLWFRDPAMIEILPSPIPNREMYYVRVPEETIDFIMNNGKYADGTKDEKTWAILKEQYGDFVRAVKDGKHKFLLEEVQVLRRKVISGSPYPVPFLYPALESMIHKRNLRKMDFALASRVISAIQLIKIGSDEFPLLEDDADVVDELKKQMRWRERRNMMDRVFQLFVNHTVNIEWVFPELDALLSEEKFRSVNRDILFALGFPRVLMVGETERTGTANTEFSLLGPAETLGDIRQKLISLIKEIYMEILERNPQLTNAPEPAFTPVRLYDIDKMANLASKAREMGVISKTTYALLIGEDFTRELEYMVEEKDKAEELGVTEFPEVPYSEKPTPKDGEQEVEE